MFWIEGLLNEVLRNFAQCFNTKFSKYSSVKCKWASEFISVYFERIELKCKKTAKLQMKHTFRRGRRSNSVTVYLFCVFQFTAWNVKCERFVNAQHRERETYVNAFEFVTHKLSLSNMPKANWCSIFIHLISPGSCYSITIQQFNETKNSN